MKHCNIFGLLCAAVMFSIPASAADLPPAGPAMAQGHCRVVTRSMILDLGRGKIVSEIDRRYSHALQISLDKPTISSKRPTHTWASEAKVSCAKAKGFLASGEVDEGTINECDCFYDRMVFYISK